MALLRPHALLDQYALEHEYMTMRSIKGGGITSCRIALNASNLSAANFCMIHEIFKI